MFFFVFFINLERHKSFAYLPKNWDQNQVVHFKNFIWWDGLILKFLEKVFRRDERPQGIEE